ncbi:MAG TPA: lipid-binding SYLF domain-containing protein [Bryobacteraceae bacterium]|nr:lipid-binding SYLF domain-containing protein [Bryobacteraceae bacterium]
MKVRLLILAAIGTMFAFAAKTGTKPNDAVRRIDAAVTVFHEIMATPDKGIPQDLLERAQCVGVVPSLKHGGFIIGGKYGKGVLACRDSRFRYGWTGPSTIRIEGGSFGFQIGGGETDLVFIVMDKSGQEKLMQSKFTIGGDAGAMAGPVGRSASAQTDALMHAKILSYSRARGIFAGIALTGATLRPDDDDNRAIYGRDVTQHDILNGDVKPPSIRAVRRLDQELNRYTPKHKKPSVGS